MGEIILLIFQLGVLRQATSEGEHAHGLRVRARLAMGCGQPKNEQENAGLASCCCSRTFRVRPLTLLSSASSCFSIFPHFSHSSGILFFVCCAVIIAGEVSNAIPVRFIHFDRNPRVKQES